MKYKSVALLLATLLVLVLGARLPHIVGAVQDRKTDAVGYADVSEIYLEFTKDDLSLRDKMYLHIHAYQKMEIPTNLASTPVSEILNLAEQTLTVYRRAGLIPYELTGGEGYHATPSLFYGEDNQTAIYWNVTVYDTNGSWDLSLTIDDSTGSILTCYFFNYDTGSRQDVSQTQLQSQLRSLCDLVLQEFGSELSEYTVESVMKNVDNWEFGDGDETIYDDYLSTTIGGIASDLGNFEMILIVRRDGFSVNAYTNSHFEK